MFQPTVYVVKYEIMLMKTASTDFYTTGLRNRLRALVNYPFPYATELTAALQTCKLQNLFSRAVHKHITSIKRGTFELFRVRITSSFPNASCCINLVSCTHHNYLGATAHPPLIHAG